MSQAETHSFQAEVRQVLDIVIHSLYTDREIFVRELISNASDALEKLRFRQVAGEAIFDDHLPMKIIIQTNEEDNTISFSDSGIGMNREELIENLGTIAHSGSKKFLQQVAGQQDKGVQLIGQFGVGFYAAFMVAKEVSVFSRTYAIDGQSWHWKSDGTGSYTIEPETGVRRGTKIIVRLKDEHKEFSKEYRIESIIKKYSNFVGFPIELNGKEVNTVQAIWTRQKSEVKDSEYEEFYKFIAHDVEPPRYRLHFSADAPLAIQSLLFVPSQNIERMGMGRIDAETHLYCKKILIQSKAKGLLPEWLRFVKGVVDSEDLPLNISRETMQDSALIQKLNKVLTGRWLKFFEDEAKTNPDRYDLFYQEYGMCIKEGVVQDFVHRDALSKLLRFESTETELGKRTSLSDYINRMKSEQKDIYYLVAPSRKNAESSPYIEALKEKNWEVLILVDPWDEFVMENLREFEGKKLLSAEKADISSTRETVEKLKDDQAKTLASWMQDHLGNRVENVKVSTRLVGSPVAVVHADPHMTSTMRKMMKAMERREGIDSLNNDKLVLEINPSHPLLIKLESYRGQDDQVARMITDQLFDEALVSAGLLEETAPLLKRMDELMNLLLERSAKS